MSAIGGSGHPRLLFILPYYLFSPPSPLRLAPGGTVHSNINHNAMPHPSPQAWQLFSSGMRAARQLSTKPYHRSCMPLADKFRDHRRPSSRGFMFSPPGMLVTATHAASVCFDSTNSRPRTWSSGVQAQILRSSGRSANGRWLSEVMVGVGGRHEPLSMLSCKGFFGNWNPWTDFSSDASSLSRGGVPY